MDFSNEELSVTVNKKAHCKVEFAITAHELLIRKAAKEAVKSVSKEVSLPGFRKGKAPLDLVQKKYAQQIREQTQKSLASLAFTEAQKLVKIPPLNRDTSVSYSMKNFSDVEANISFTFETEPSLPDLVLSSFKLSTPKKQKIEKKEVDEAVRQLQFFYAKWTPITHRGIEENDYVLIDLETLEEPSQKVFSDTRFEVSEKSMAKWMQHLLLGKKSGDKVEGISEPDNKDDPDFVSKRVLVTVKKIEMAELPHLDEDFATKVGAKSIEELRKSMEELLIKKIEEKEEKELRDQVNQFLLSHTFALPESLVQAEKEHRQKQLVQNPKYQERWRSLSEAEKKEAEETLHQQAEEAVRLFYISRKVVQDSGVTISNEEIQNEALRTLQVFAPVKIDSKQIPKEVYALALSKLMLSKAQDQVIEKAQTQSA